ncbi:MAG: hypothetical protein ACK4VI_00730 [Alphaproteobacteria bacterium]
MGSISKSSIVAFGLAAGTVIASIGASAQFHFAKEAVISDLKQENERLQRAIGEAADSDRGVLGIFVRAHQAGEAVRALCPETVDRRFSFSPPVGQQTERAIQNLAVTTNMSDLEAAHNLLDIFAERNITIMATSLLDRTDAFATFYPEDRVLRTSNFLRFHSNQMLSILETIESHDNASPPIQDTAIAWRRIAGSFDLEHQTMDLNNPVWRFGDQLQYARPLDIPPMCE